MIKKKSSLVMTLILFAVIMFTFTACDPNKKLSPPSQMVGTWVGMGRVMISNEYLNQRQMPVMLIIEDDGIITGFIGDASIQKAKLQPANLFVKLFGKVKYVSAFKLDGSIVNRESFRRDGGTVEFENISENEITCSFKSEGSQMSSTNIELVVKDIKLNRQ